MITPQEIRRQYWQRLEEINTPQHRGFVTKSFEWDCYNCVCRLCTGDKCRYRKTDGLYRYRCARCVQSQDMLRLFDCDGFVNRLTVPRRFKIKRRFRRKGEIEKRLDLIMQQLGIDLPEALEDGKIG